MELSEELRLKRNSRCVDLTLIALKRHKEEQGQCGAFKVVVLDAAKDAYESGYQQAMEDMKEEIERLKPQLD